MARAIILLLFFSHLSFADNTTQITFKGSGSNITTKQVGSGNATYILCGSPTNNGSGTFPGTTYTSHTCSNANWTSNVDGNSNTVRLYTVWSNHTDNTYTINIDGDDNFVWLDQDEDDNTSTITQTGNDNHAEQLGSGDDNTFVITQTGNNKYAKILDFGDDGNKTITQSGTGAHNTYIYNNGSGHNNTATVIQSGSGNKDADLFFYGADNSDIDLTQSGAGAHTAYMRFYTNNYDVDVTQSGANNQSYSATFNCSSNCTKTISITQQ